MRDYNFDYNGESFRVPTPKIFDCLYDVGEIASIGSIGQVVQDNDFMKIAKVFSIITNYTGKPQNPIEVTQHYLYAEGGAIEIVNAIGGIVSLLNPPESYHPPEGDAVK